MSLSQVYFALVIFQKTADRGEALKTQVETTLLKDTFMFIKEISICKGVFLFIYQKVCVCVCVCVCVRVHALSPSVVNDSLQPHAL